jgi:hypothetical protein
LILFGRNKKRFFFDKKKEKTGKHTERQNKSMIKRIRIRFPRSKYDIPRVTYDGWSRYFSDEPNSGVKFNSEIPGKPKSKIRLEDESPSSSTILDTKAPDKLFYVEAQKKAEFATKIGAVANLSLAVSKGIIGLSIASTALIADAVNSLGDIVGDAVVFYTMKEARKKASPDRPWGKGKLEPLGALTVGTLLFATGVGIGYSSLHAVLEILEIPAVNLFEYLPQIGGSEMIEQSKEATFQKAK